MAASSEERGGSNEIARSAGGGAAITRRAASTWSPPSAGRHPYAPCMVFDPGDRGIETDGRSQVLRHGLGQGVSGRDPHGLDTGFGQCLVNDRLLQDEKKGDLVELSVVVPPIVGLDEELGIGVEGLGCREVLQ